MSSPKRASLPLTRTRGYQSLDVDTKAASADRRTMPIGGRRAAAMCNWNRGYDGPRIDPRTVPIRGRPTVCVVCSEPLPARVSHGKHYHVHRARLYCAYHQNPAHRPPTCDITHEIDDDCPMVHPGDPYYP
jgi:hypothetical protein